MLSWMKLIFLSLTYNYFSWKFSLIKKINVGDEAAMKKIECVLHINDDHNDKNEWSNLN